MNAYQAWQSVLGQLQVEMPKASFDTWVRDTRPLSYENGAMTIGAANAYARDWLDSRLSSTVARLLVGVLNSDVAVNFVVADIDSKREEESNESVIDDDSNNVVAQESAATEYERIVRPDRVVAFPGYLLRHLEQKCIPPEELSLYIGARQGVYLNWIRGGEPQIMVQNISAWDLLYFSNMSHASLFRLINGRKEFAGGALQKLDEPAPHTGKKYLDYANRWRVMINPPLTRNDAAALEAILRAAGEEASKSKKGEAVVAALTDLVQRKPDEYLSTRPSEEALAVWPKTVMEIVYRVLGQDKAQLPESVRHAAENLQNSLMTAFGTVIVTHFFFKFAHLVKMSHAKFWWIITARKHLVYNHNTTEQYDYTILPFGYKTLAQWVGVDEDTARLWLDKDPVIRTFMTPIPVSEAFEDWKRNGSMALRVRLEEPPVWEILGTDTWQQLETALVERKGSKRSLVEIVGDAEDNKDGQGANQKPDSTNRKMRLDEPKDETQQTDKRDSINRKMRLGQPETETRSTEGCDSNNRRVRLDLRGLRLDPPKDAIPLKTLLEPLQNLYKNPKKPQGAGRSPTTTKKGNHASGQRHVRRAGVGGSLAYWDFDTLCVNNSIGAKGALLKTSKKFGRSLKTLSEGIVSYILYGYSEWGGGVDPIKLAVSRLTKNINSFAGPDFQKLAKMGPTQLKDFIDADRARRDHGPRRYSEKIEPDALDGSEVEVESALYLSLFGNLERERLDEMYRRLFGGSD